MHFLHIAFFVQFSFAKIQSRPPRRIGRELPQLQLFILAAEVVFARRKKKKMNKARQDAKTQRQSASAESQTERITISLCLSACLRKASRCGSL
jgi:hypothetical protein